MTDKSLDKSNDLLKGQSIEEAKKNIAKRSKNKVNDNKEEVEEVSQSLIFGRSIKEDSSNKTKEEKDGKTYPIFLSEESREGVTLFLKLAKSGKSQFIIPSLFKQDLDKKDAGMTIICSQKDLAYTLYAMTKDAKRKVVLIKPSTNFAILNELLKMDEWNYKYIDQYVIDYKKAIEKREVVIIDMEYDYYRNDAVRATIMLLLQFQTDMTMTPETKKRKHYFYIDDCQRYLPFIEMLIESGKAYNVYTNLFFQGRNQFKTNEKDYTGFVDNNVRNTILMNNLNFDDCKYYAEKLCPKEIEYKDYLYDMNHMKYGWFSYDIQDQNHQTQSGKGILQGLGKEYNNRIKKKAIKYRKQLTKVNDNAHNIFLLQPEIQMLHNQNSQRKINLYKDEFSEVKEEIASDTLNKNIQNTAPTSEVISDKNSEENIKDISQDTIPDITGMPAELDIPSIKEEDSGEFSLLADVDGLEPDVPDDFDMMMPDDIPDIELTENKEDKEDLDIDSTLDASYSNDDDEIEMDEKMEYATTLTKFKGKSNSYLIFPEIVKSMQKQFNDEVKKIK